MNEQLTHTIDGAVETTDLPRSTIYKAIKDGRIKVVQAMGRKLIPHSELVRLVTEGDTTPSRRGFNSLVAVNARKDRQPDVKAKRRVAK